MANAANAPSFYRDVLPILQAHCQTCHREGEIAPMPFGTYAQVRPWAAAIREATRLKNMPPWFADPGHGQFLNDPSLTPDQIATLSAWADAHAPAGDAKDAPTPPNWTQGWNIEKPDVVLQMPAAFRIPATGDIEYQYIIIPAHFKEDRWVRMSEIRPSNRSVVHHAVAYVREPGSKWLRGAPVNVPFTAGDLSDSRQRRDAMFTLADLLLVYAPGSLPDQWPEDYAKFVPAGSDIVLQMHYTAHGKATEDRTSIGLVFAKRRPLKRVITVQLTNDRFVIPPGDPDHRVAVRGTLPNDALLLSFFPHMHLRGKTFEYDMVEPGGKLQTLLRVPHYNFFWQLSYRLTQPLPLKAGTVLQAVATYDNSRNNPHNPDPDSAVSWGEQTSEEMMVGFFDVAVDPSIDKTTFFIRPGTGR